MRRRALFCIGQSARGIPQKEIGERLGVSHAAVHALLARLEEKGLLKSRVDSQDGRKKIVVLTPKGKTKVQALANHQREDFLSDLLNDEERERFEGALNKIVISLLEEEKRLKEG